MVKPRSGHIYENKLRTPVVLDEIPADIPAEEPVKEQAEPAGRKSKAPGKGLKTFRRWRKGAQEFLGGDYLSKETVTGNIGFILFLGLLAMLYISNTYYTEKIHKKIESTKNELKELRFQHITTKSALMFQGRQSEISKKAVSMGLNESKIPPFKIQYSGESLSANRDKP